MSNRISKPSIDWGKWHFDDVEPYFVELLKGTGVEYDPKHPLSVLPPDAAQKALEFLGIKGLDGFLLGLLGRDIKGGLSGIVIVVVIVFHYLFSFQR